jgi:hypothetical protein
MEYLHLHRFLKSAFRPGPDPVRLDEDLWISHGDFTSRSDHILPGETRYLDALQFWPTGVP